MEIRNGFSFRTAVRFGWHALALGCLSLSAHAQSDFGDKTWWKADGASWVPDYNKSAAFPSKATPLGGALVVNGAGIVHGPAEWPKASARSGIPGLNKSAPIDVVARFKPSSVAGAFGRLATKVGPLSSALALVTFAAEIGFVLTDSETPGGPPQITKSTTTRPCQAARSGQTNTFGATCMAAAQAMYAKMVSGGGTVAGQIVYCGAETGTFAPACGYSWTGAPPGAAFDMAFTGPATTQQTPSTQQEFQDAIAAKSGWPTSSAIGPAIAEALRSGEVIETETATVSGPASNPVKSSTVNNPNGSTTTNTTTNNYTYNGPKVTVTTTTVSTTVNPSTGTTETTTTTETEAPPETAPVEEEQKNQCDLTPNALGCAELDTPEAEIPRDTETIDFQEENVFGSGSCPANLTATIATLGQSVTVWDWSKTCALALPLRALVLGLASFAALLIVMPGGNKT